MQPPAPEPDKQPRKFRRPGPGFIAPADADARANGAAEALNELAPPSETPAASGEDAAAPVGGAAPEPSRPVDLVQAGENIGALVRAPWLGAALYLAHKRNAQLLDVQRVYNHSRRLGEKAAPRLPANLLTHGAFDFIAFLADLTGDFLADALRDFKPRPAKPELVGAAPS